MKRETSDYFKERKVSVTVNFDGQLMRANLHFGASQKPMLVPNNYFAPEVLAFRSFISDKDTLECISESDDTIFNLTQIDVDDWIFSARYLTIGKQLCEVNKFEIDLTGVSIWIERNRAFNFNGEFLERNFSVEKFNEDFSFDGEVYNISNVSHIDTNNISPVECHVSVEHKLVVSKKNGLFSLYEIKKISHELRNLFSLLLGAPLSISQLLIYSDNDPYKYQWLFFPTVLYVQEPLKDSFNSIINFHYLTSELKWHSVLKNYFSKESFRNIWNRIIPSFTKLGVWEYDILTRVIILEMYAHSKTDSKKLSLSEDLKTKFKKGLKKAIDEFSKSNKLSDNDLIVFEGMARSILQTKNTSLPTLKERFDELIEELTPDLRIALSFTDEDFKRIKRIRDSVAHGNKYEKYIPGVDITYEMQLSDRLLVLLMCFVYLELGFSENEIVKFFNSSHCGFISGAGLNKRELDRLSGNALFVKLSYPPKETVLENFDMIVLKHSVEENAWCLDEELTRKIKTEWHKSGIHNMEEYVKSLISNSENYKLDYRSQVYVESGGVETQHFFAVVISSHDM